MENKLQDQTRKRKETGQPARASKVVPPAVASALAAAEAQLGTAAMPELLAHLDRGEATEERHAEAQKIGRARVAQGDPGGDECDRAAIPNARPSRYVRPAVHAQRERKQRDSLHLRTHLKAVARADKKAEAFGERLQKEHGRRADPRPVNWGAWFDSYKAGADKNGDLAVSIVSQAGIPTWRLEAVWDAALRPKRYQPTRTVTVKKRAHQTPFQTDMDQPPGLACRKDHDHNDQCRLYPDWEDQWTRKISHPQAIYVCQCAAFLWKSKDLTKRGGFTFKLRGQGAGVFASLCRVTIKTLFGHARGVPGAMRSLRTAGFFQFGQPPACKVSPRDVGTKTGHAFNLYWWVASAAEKALTAVHDRVAELMRLPILIRLARERDDAKAKAARAPPPVVIIKSEIPF